MVREGMKKGLSASILRPTAVLGPGDYSVSLTGRMLRAIFRNKLPALLREGYDWVDVRDVAKAVVLCLNHSPNNETYLISGHWASALEISALCRDISGRPTPRLGLPAWMAYMGLPFMVLQSRISGRPPVYTRESLDTLCKSNRNISHDKGRRELGYAPRPLIETLRDTYTWYKEQGYI